MIGKRIGFVCAVLGVAVAATVSALVMRIIGPDGEVRFFQHEIEQFLDAARSTARGGACAEVEDVQHA